MLAVVGCGGEAAPSGVNADVVVAMVAERDGLPEEDAARRVRDVHLLADAARAERNTVVDPPPLVTESRSRFLRRGALARLWMTEVFEPSHEADAIPDDDPLYLRALASPLHVRPQLYRLCQVVAVPSGFEDEGRRKAQRRRGREVKTETQRN